MRYVAIFEDSPGMVAVRAERGALHLAYLKQRAGEILISGGLRDEPDGSFCGGLWVLEVPNGARAVELIENDPYYAPEYRKYKLKVWGKVLDHPVTL